MNEAKLLIGSLVVLLTVSIGISLALFQANKDSKSCEIKPETQEANLIDNEYTKNLGKLPDGWKTYKNDTYGFQINYPETTFDGNKINIVDVKFKNREDLAATGGDQRIGGGTGSYKTVKDLIDFNTTVQHNGDAGVINVLDSLFTIGIHPNESNLPFQEFVSQEILSYYKGDEILRTQKIVEVNGVKGYEFTYAYSNGGEAISYYFPSKDGKTIFSINTAFTLLGAPEIPGVTDIDNVMLAFSKANPQFNLGDMEKYFVENGQDAFLKKYPNYQLFEKEFTIKYLQREWTKQITFDQIAYSFNL